MSETSESLEIAVKPVGASGGVEARINAAELESGPNPAELAPATT